MKANPQVTRTQPPLELTRSPLILVLAQVRMTPVLKMAEYIPEIQDRLRKNGFPKAHKRATRTEAQDAQGNTLKVEEQNDWVFLSKEDQEALTVNENGIYLTSANYTSFENFLTLLERCLDIVHEVVRIGGVERLGLRYVDLIEPTPEKPLSHYVVQEILGLPLQDLGSREAYVSQTVLNTGLHQMLILRFVERPKGVTLPPDLLSAGVKLKKAMKLDTSFGILDSDHYTEFPEPVDFSTEEVSTRLGSLHVALDQSFREAVTPDALEKEWK